MQVTAIEDLIVLYIVYVLSLCLAPFPPTIADAIGNAELHRK
jgi:hypothetical protein